MSAVFGLAGNTQNLCIDAVRIVSVRFEFVGINIAYEGIDQAIDSGLESLIISVLRQCIIVLPLAYLFSNIAIKNSDKIWLIWTCFPITEAVTAFVAYLLMKRINRTKLSELN